MGHPISEDLIRRVAYVLLVCLRNKEQVHICFLYVFCVCFGDCLYLNQWYWSIWVFSWLSHCSTKPFTHRIPLSSIWISVYTTQSIFLNFFTNFSRLFFPVFLHVPKQESLNLAGWIIPPLYSVLTRQCPLQQHILQHLKYNTHASLLSYSLFYISYICRHILALSPFLATCSWFGIFFL